MSLVKREVSETEVREFDTIEEAREFAKEFVEESKKLGKVAGWSIEEEGDLIRVDVRMEKEKKGYVPFYPTGTVFENKRDGGKYILAQIDAGVYSLISIDTGNRWKEGVFLGLSDERGTLQAGVFQDELRGIGGRVDYWEVVK